MSLIPWSMRRINRSRTPSVSGSSLLSLRNDMDRLFDRFLTRPWLGFEEDFAPTDAWIPLLDVSENGNEIVLRAELPGVKHDDVKVTVSDHFLTIAGEKSESKEEKDESYCHCERRFGSLQRSIELPGAANADKISASFSDGVLTVNVPKLETAKSREVEVKPAEKNKTARPVPVATR